MYPEHLPNVDNQIYAYLLIDYKTSEILDGNSLAKSFYKTDNHYPELETLFTPSSTGATITEILKTLEAVGSIYFNNISSVKGNGEQFNCHVEATLVSDSIVFLVVTETSFLQDSKISHLVKLTGNPVFVLDHDEQLTATYDKALSSSLLPLENPRAGENWDHSFLFLIPDEERVAFLQTVNHQLDEEGECDIDLELNFGTEYYPLFRFNCFKSTYDGKLYGVLISAKKQSELIKKIEYDQQYFDIMQKFTKDLLFRIDVPNSTLVHRGDISMFVDLRPEMEDFPETMRENRLVHPDDLEGFIAFSYRLMKGMEATFEPRLQFKNGIFERYRLQGNPLFDSEGRVVQVVGKSENIQKFVEMEAMAHYDALTSALNKQSFKRLMDDNLQRAVVSDRFALLFIDLDDFKGVNDTMGHVFGDFLLEATGKRIKNCIRSRDRLGRVGGDEFVVFFQFAPSHETVLERAEAILHSLRREFTYGEQRYKLKSSIGISLFPEHGATYDILYHRADKALYASKAKGKDVATIYSEDLG